MKKSQYLDQENDKSLGEQKLLKILIGLLLLFTFSCSKKSDSESLVSGEVVADPEGITPVAPILSPLSNQSIFE